MKEEKFKEILNKDLSDFFGKKNKKRKRKKKEPFFSKNFNPLIASLVILAFLLGIFGVLAFEKYTGQTLQEFISPKSPLTLEKVKQQTKLQGSSGKKQPYQPLTYQEKAVIEAVKKVSPSVVSIVITKDLPVLVPYYENPFEEFKKFFGNDFPFEFQIPQYRQEGKKKQKVGGGTGFIISSDGLILTNKHVVADTEAEYSVITNDGERYDAEVLARDPFQDLAIIKIKPKDGEKIKLKPVELGDSSTLQIGQSVIAIGNALGEFRNTVSVGVISGLGRTITASGGGIIETLEDVIQTDAAINRGNSGGPLLNLRGEVIGVDVAMAEGAQSIGFAIPINKAKRDIAQIKKLGKIVYPFLGVRYVLVNPELQKEKNLPVGYGALVTKGSRGEPAVVPGSAAEKAGLKEGDIILELNGEKITLKNTLSKLIQEHNPGEEVTLLVLRGGKRIALKAVLGERTGS
jgi:serine protease Do